MDIKIINVQAEPHKREDPKYAMTKDEKNNKRLYKDRMEKVENALFIPMISQQREKSLGKHPAPYPE